MKCRILECNKCIITSPYGERKINKKTNYHNGIDIVKEGYQLDYIVAHTDGLVCELVDGKLNNKGNNTYGNYVKILHKNGYYTLYAHMEKNLYVKKYQNIKKGDRIGYMGDSGDANGKHLHFEVWKNNIRINPTEYLNSNLPNNDNSLVVEKHNHNLNEEVTINSVYKTSTSNIKLKPLINKGKITKIKNGVPNPYLLDNGKIGWINDECIIESIKFLSNNEYKGYSIVEALKQIKINSSYDNRSKLAKLNNINNYKGTKEQNTYLLNLLKLGKLKYY